MPPKRKAEEIEAELQQQTEVAKRLKESVDTVASELMCAISHELPVNPVTAEDGQVYERSAIEAWIARPGVLKSPKLNTPMGPRLFPSTQARNIIEQMVRSGAISGPKADAWAKKLAAEKVVKEVVRMAANGDAEAMCELGLYYYDGEMGLAVDYKQAADWFQRGDDLGHATCSAMLGRCYEEGCGVEKDEVYSLCLYGIAAARGSELGCHNLAAQLSAGRCGARTNARAATRWYRAMERATVRDAFDLARDSAAEWLRKHAVE